MSRILPAKDLVITWGDNSEYWSWKKNDTGDTRFPEVAELVYVYLLEINAQINSIRLSRGAEYAVYLIYKLDANVLGLKQPYYQTATIEFNGKKTETNVNLDSETLEAYAEGSGWNQIKLGNFQNNAFGGVHVKLAGSEGADLKRGLTVAGMEFRQVNGGAGVEPGCCSCLPLPWPFK